jgi:thioredoxin-dependent peroxiredoxin
VVVFSSVEAVRVADRHVRSVYLGMPVIEIGRPAPKFTLRDQHGKSHSLKDYAGRVVVMYFYPEDDTPLCTAQACQFRDHHPDFTKIKAVVLGVSPQGTESKRAFASAHALPFTLLADDVMIEKGPDKGPDKGPGNGPRTCVEYGAWGEKNMYGKIVRGMIRTTYLIDGNGIVVRRWDRVKTPGHALAVLEAVKKLHSGEKLSVLGELKPLKRAKTVQKTRTQGGHAGYSGSHRPGKVSSRGAGKTGTRVKSRGK